MSTGCRLFVGNISSRANEDDVHKFFKGCGHIRDVIMKNGFGFVEFDDRRDAEDAADDMNGKEMMGNRVKVELARARGFGGFRGGGDRGGDRYGGGGRYGSDRGSDRYGGGDRYGGSSAPRRPNTTDYRVIVENISSRASWQDLKEFMQQAGEVAFADANRQKPGEGFVCYTRRSEMKKAMEKLDGKELNGHKVKLVEDYRGKSRSRSRSGSRSPKGRSRSRSRSSSAEKERKWAKKEKSEKGAKREKVAVKGDEKEKSVEKNGDEKRTNGKKTRRSPSLEEAADAKEERRSRSGSPGSESHSE